MPAVKGLANTFIRMISLLAYYDDAEIALNQV